jgi:hypothetical protein
MHDQRVSDRALFRLKYFSHRLIIAGIGRKSVHSLGWHSDEVAGTKQAGSFLNVSWLCCV